MKQKKQSFVHNEEKNEIRKGHFSFLICHGALREGGVYRGTAREKERKKERKDFLHSLHVAPSIRETLATSNHADHTHSFTLVDFILSI